MWLFNRTGQCCHLPNCNEAMNLACCLWINSTVTPSSHYLQKWVNHYAKLIQRLIGLHIESDVLMRVWGKYYLAKTWAWEMRPTSKALEPYGKILATRKTGRRLERGGLVVPYGLQIKAVGFGGKSSYWRSLTTLLELGPSNLDFSIRRLFF